jgi:hypothetical protein
MIEEQRALIATCLHNVIEVMSVSDDLDTFSGRCQECGKEGEYWPMNIYIPCDMVAIRDDFLPELPEEIWLEGLERSEAVCTALVKCPICGETEVPGEEELHLTCAPICNCGNGWECAPGTCPSNREEEA